MNAALVERLAEHMHLVWTAWMCHMFKASCGELRPDGAWVIPASLAKRWKRQMFTAYPELSEEEKKSDRNTAAAILLLIEDWHKHNDDP